MTHYLLMQKHGRKKINIQKTNKDLLSHAQVIGISGQIIKIKKMKNFMIVL